MNTAINTFYEIKINGTPMTQSLVGVRMDDNFLSTLDEPLTPKEYITNESRLEHGKRVVVGEDGFRYQSRDISLGFIICAPSPLALATYKKRFLGYITKGEFVLEVPDFASKTGWHLLYGGNGTEYYLSSDRCLCRMVLKFTEANPDDRSPYTPTLPGGGTGGSGSSSSGIGDPVTGGGLSP